MGLHHLLVSRCGKWMPAALPGTMRQALSQGANNCKPGTRCVPIVRVHLVCQHKPCISWPTCFVTADSCHWPMPSTCWWAHAVGQRSSGFQDPPLCEEPMPCIGKRGLQAECTP